jgi:hypothetical protein
MSSFLNGDMTEQYLVKLYDDFVKEQQRLLTDMKNLNDESMSKESDIQKQLQLVTSLITTILKLRNAKKKIQSKLSGN